jgi:hypothetical protein
VQLRAGLCALRAGGRFWKRLWGPAAWRLDRRGSEHVRQDQRQPGEGPVQLTQQLVLQGRSVHELQPDLSREDVGRHDPDPDLGAGLQLAGAARGHRGFGNLDDPGRAVSVAA